MANEPVQVDGGENPLARRIDYHYRLALGGAEGMVEVVAASKGLIVSGRKAVLPGHLHYREANTLLTQGVMQVPGVDC